MNEETANKVCPKCGGTGVCVTTGNTVCPMCEGKGFIDVFTDQMQGCNHNYPPDHIWQATGPVNGFPKSYGYDNRKTLLDEFAMAALQGSVSCASPLMVGGKPSKDVEDYAAYSYNIAAAMMAERARRDEMGNVKETK